MEFSGKLRAYAERVGRGAGAAACARIQQIEDQLVVILRIKVDSHRLSRASVLYLAAANRELLARVAVRESERHRTGWRGRGS